MGGDEGMERGGREGGEGGGEGDGGVVGGVDVGMFVIVVLLLISRELTAYESAVSQKLQVAYELLLAHNNEDLHDQASLAEFVDQCKASN